MLMVQSKRVQQNYLPILHDISGIQTIFYRPVYCIQSTNHHCSEVRKVVNNISRVIFLLTNVSSRYSTVDGNPFSLRLAFSVNHFSNLSFR